MPKDWTDQEISSELYSELRLALAECVRRLRNAKASKADASTEERVISKCDAILARSAPKASTFDERMDRPTHDRGQTFVKLAWFNDYQSVVVAGKKSGLLVSCNSDRADRPFRLLPAHYGLTVTFTRDTEEDCEVYGVIGIVDLIELAVMPIRREDDFDQHGTPQSIWIPAGPEREGLELRLQAIEEHIRKVRRLYKSPD